MNTRLKAQPALPPILMTAPKRRPLSNGKVTVLDTRAHTFTPTAPVMSERDDVVLREFRREMRACDERACLCECHCHGGIGICYGDSNETSKDTETRFHRRRPNTSNKRAHRECPKEGREHNRR